jgi:hypothetical protein
MNSSPPIQTLPTVSLKVLNIYSNGKHYITYKHARVKWRSSHFIKVEDHTPKLIIVRLGNDGFLYFNPSALEVDDVVNCRHKHITPSGWKVFKTGAIADGVEEKLADFKGRLRWPGLEPTRFASPSFTIRPAGESTSASNPRSMGLALNSAFKPTGFGGTELLVRASFRVS